MNKHEMSDMRKREFESALLNRMLQMPYQDIAVTHLVQAVGVSRKTFYLHFPSKDACLTSLLDQVLLDEATYVLHHGTDIYSMHVAGFRYWLAHRDFLTCILKQNLIIPFLYRILSHIQEEEQEIIRSICLPISDQPYDADSLMFFVSGFLSVLMSWVQRGFDTPPEEMAKKMQRLTQRPLLPDE